MKEMYGMKHIDYKKSNNLINNQNIHLGKLKKEEQFRHKANTSKEITTMREYGNKIENRKIINPIKIKPYLFK